MLISALRSRVQRLGAPPLITYYEGDSRISLSAITFANWVDKTANLIADLGHEDGEPIDLALAESHPGHWVTLVWVAAAWQRGCPVNPGVTGAEFLVVGPDDDRRADVTVACSLHPLGRGFTTPPADAVDYVEVFAQPDVHDPSPLGESTVWAGSPVPATEPRSTKTLLTDPAAGWDTVATALVAPVLGGGSTVVTVGMDDDAVARIAAEEKIPLDQ
ncbi:MAG TPA: hypothetical protein K8V15_06105 [Tessaracoccus flavescens]|uniref:TIGR03089 family protein n=1 Tax=Tessaracoccus flavescens TaxID=399497 RepID=A0A921EPP4_9ACTN|nr:hypothetical protein [Tessaracoccus flavescens]